MEYDRSLIFSLGQGLLDLFIHDDVDSPEAVLDIVPCGSHGMVMIEEHARQLIIRGLDHLSSFYQPLAYSYSP
jgi:hypothetical protein